MQKFHALTKYFHKHKSLVKSGIIIAVAIPLIIAVTSVLSGNISLWYDNARDLLSGWNNLSKLTLIGPTSGIPGIFYGPYWIWLLSFGLLFSKDPRIVILITATIPYFIIFSLIWFRFSKFWGVPAVTVGWLLFIFSTGMTYATQLWNPYPAPLIALAIMYLLLTNNCNRLSYKSSVRIILLGFLLGLLINFHVSFGIGFTFGVVLFFVVNTLCLVVFEKKRKISLLKQCIAACLCGTGMFLAFIPFFLFEFRHGFHQIAVIYQTLGKYGAVVSIKGLTKMQIFQQFLITLANLLHMTIPISILFLVLASGLLVVLVKMKKIQLTKMDVRTITLIVSLFTGISFIYFTAKNPVWSYHFIGVDTLFLILITFLLAKISLLKNISVVWAVCITIISISAFSNQLNNHQPSALANQKQIITTISTDAGKSAYTVIAYSPSIYIYEYTYLFRWLANKDVPYDPGQNPPSPKIIYLIVPLNRDAKVTDFINYRSPKNQYITKRLWKTANGNEILKQIRIH